MALELSSSVLYGYAHQDPLADHGSRNVVVELWFLLHAQVLPFERLGFSVTTPTAKVRSGPKG